MKKTALIALMSVAVTVPAFAQNKIDDRLGTSAEVLKQILAKPDAPRRTSTGRSASSSSPRLKRSPSALVDPMAAASSSAGLARR